jgi:hypothetical protein
MYLLKTKDKILKLRTQVNTIKLASAYQQVFNIVADRRY